MPGNKSCGTWTVAALLAASLLLGGCASLGIGKQSEQHQSEQERRATRAELNEGYSLLYMSTDGLSKLSEVLYVKVESDATQRVVDDISNYAGKLHGDLERIAKDYPAVKIDLDPLPEIDKLKRQSIKADNRKELYPVVGKTGAAFERTFLLSASGALNNLRFQCQVMAEEEPVDSLRTFLTNCHDRFTDLYNEDVKLLNERYFKDNTYEPKKR